MSSKTKWIIAAVLVLGIVVVAQASVLNDIYMPVIYVGPTITPIPTATPKSTVCLYPETPIEGLDVCFINIVPKPTTNMFDEMVTIKNLQGSAVEMQGWRISSDSSSFKYDFPKFTLKPGLTVEVWTKIGTDSSSKLFMNRPLKFWEETNLRGFWKDNADCGYLMDDSQPHRQKINSFCYGITGFTAAPENK